MQIQTQNDNDGKNYKWEKFPAGLHRLMDNVFTQRLSWHDFLDLSHISSPYICHKNCRIFTWGRREMKLRSIN